MFKVSMIVLALLLGVFSVFFANGLREKNLSDATTAQRLKAFEKLPLCGAQTALDSGGACRPI
jgi:hypothetical protein